VTRHTGGKILAFLAMFFLPILAIAGGVADHFHRSKSTEFCISCHVMEPYYESLFLDDARHLPAVHYQNRTIDRDHACFTCHTQYTMFGGLKAKLNGLKHLWVYYFGGGPEKIELYEPFNVRECLHCHAGSRAYEEQAQHVEEREGLASGELTCFSCHFKSHGVDELHRLRRWKPEGGE
jgi:cytochrome c-type protein NapC